MNKLPLSKRIQIITALVEGNSLRATSRIADVSINTVTKLLIDVGTACAKFHDEEMLNVKSKRIQCDEIWSFVGAKEKNTSAEMKEKGFGDVWTWTALDADSKLIVSWFVGDRSADSAYNFMQDVAGRIAGNIQLTTDGHKPYLEAVEDACVGIEYAKLIKIYGASDGGRDEKPYSPAESIGAAKKVILGRPDPKYISTSYVERQNLTMCMHMRRFIRLTNGFSKKIENHCHAIALHFVYYNFAKIHKTLRVTPAMEAGLTTDLMSVEDIVQLTEH